MIQILPEGKIMLSTAAIIPFIFVKSSIAIKFPKEGMANLSMLAAK